MSTTDPTPMTVGGAFVVMQRLSYIIAGKVRIVKMLINTCSTTKKVARATAIWREPP
jgi:hypothetical protein